MPYKRNFTVNNLLAHFKKITIPSRHVKHLDALANVLIDHLKRRPPSYRNAYIESVSHSLRGGTPPDRLCINLAHSLTHTNKEEIQNLIRQKKFDETKKSKLLSLFRKKMEELSKENKFKANKLKEYFKESLNGGSYEELSFILGDIEEYLRIWEKNSREGFSGKFYEPEKEHFFALFSHAFYLNPSFEIFMAGKRVIDSLSYKKEKIGTNDESEARSDANMHFSSAFKYFKEKAYETIRRFEN